LTGCGLSPGFAEERDRRKRPNGSVETHQQTPSLVRRAVQGTAQIAVEISFKE
jgi:hypothetical protein